MYGYIYVTTNTVNGKIYVGQHKSDKFDSWYIGSGLRLKNAVKKYGRDKFTVRLIDTAETKEELNEKEIYWIKKLDSRNPDVGYNLAKGGKGHPLSGDTRKRISEALKRYYATPEAKEQLRKRQLGRRLSEETKLKISRAMKGRVKSEEERKKLSEALKGNRHGCCSPEYAQKVLKGRKVSEETRKKLSEAHKGRRLPEETRKKMSEAAKKRWAMKKKIGGSHEERK